MLILSRTLPWLILSAALVHSAGVKKATEIFQVDFSKDKDTLGGCKDIGETTMNNYLSDAWTLAEAGIKLMDDYDKSVDEAERLVNALFKPGSGSNIVNSARDSFKAVKGFLEGSVTIAGGTPFLFCQSTWLVRQNMNDIFVDRFGNLATDFEPDGTLKYVKNNEVQHMVDAKAKYGGYPYYSEFHKGYLFDQAYSNRKVGYCSSKGSQGATQDQTSPNTITLCPASFKTARGLRQADVGTPVKAAEVKKSNSAAAKKSKRLTDILPTAATIFHEMFHLVIGVGVTAPANGPEEYGWAEIVALSASDSIRNPETYTLAAVAYDITTNYSPDGNGHRLEFYGNIGTIG